MFVSVDQDRFVQASVHSFAGIGTPRIVKIQLYDGYYEDVIATYGTKLEAERKLERHQVRGGT